MPYRSNRNANALASSTNHLIELLHVVGVPNRVLNTLPPLIDPDVVLLPRVARSTLSQLRSGHCFHLLSYQFKIGKSLSDLCPQCGPSHLYPPLPNPPYHGVWRGGVREGNIVNQ